MDHAVELVSNHPGIRLGGPFEIRPIDEDTPQRKAALDPRSPRHTADPLPTPPVSPKFACMGYIDETSWVGTTKSDQDAMLAQCAAFDDARRQNGQWLGGIALQGARSAKTVRSRDGKVVVTDGPFAETKETLGGIVVLALENIDRAAELMSQHPALRFGVVIEVRPIDQVFNQLWEATKERVLKGRSAQFGSAPRSSREAPDRTAQRV
jgi:hypothetical protein